MNTQLPLQILDYWHKIEFFESTDLKDLAVGNKGVIHYESKELAENPFCLPWLDRSQIRRAGPDYSSNGNYKFKLYLGIFKRSEIAYHAKDHFQLENEEWEERSDDSGLTCCATVLVNSDGTIDLDNLAVSTVPWALGRLIKSRLGSIVFEHFEKELKNLKKAMRTIVHVADNIKQEIGIPAMLTTYELIAFLKSICKCANYSPSEPIFGLIIQLRHPKRQTDKKPLCPIRIDTHTRNCLLNLPARLEKALTTSNEELSVETKTTMTEMSADDNDIPILNSFYIRDIELAMQQLRNGGLESQSPLALYLSNEIKRKADLLTKKGKTLIGQNLSIFKTPFGRWPSEDRHTMSLMQQFAINTIENELSDQGVYSVNGPPGTGKTTMLRDIIAHNIVERANVLAELTSPEDAFSGMISVKIGDKMVDGICQLIPELTGYEMVVVSNNNAAVENITKELPQIKALGGDYKNLEYLKPVAQKLAAEHNDHPHKTIEALEKENDRWGLIAAVLGNTKNRDIFNSRTIFTKMQNIEVVGEAAKSYRRLSTFLKELREKGHPGAAFKNAQKNYTEARLRVKEIIDDIGQIQELKELELDIDRSMKTIEALNDEQKQRRSNIKLLQSRRKKYPLRALKLIRRFRLELKIAGLKNRTIERNAELERKLHRLERLNKKLPKKRRQVEPLMTRYPDIVFYDETLDIEVADIQRSAFGHCEALNRRRAHLMVKAIELHQAWLSACYQSRNGISQTIFQLPNLILGKIENPYDAKILWQVFFMIVPVISSTFASVANQFKTFSQGDIGWLFIDEAGQASPQQAVGALLRAKRAIVVGDPLQIEPVFTTPPAFIEGFAKHVFGEADYATWSPTVTSVQKLADRVNPFGTYQIAAHQWLGSPLRVHRRCKDPMFTISNEIAYNSKMLHGLDAPSQNGNFVWGPSTWYNVAGAVDGKHYVPDQACFVLDLLYKYIDGENTLPNLFIITPFRKVKNGVRSYLRHNFSHPHIPKKSFNDWLNKRIGTVHTFQGKEEEIVILVLGVSKDSPGASNWASEKPNLLNVACTRAQKHFYIVGCKNVWAGLDNFSTAAQYLECRQ